MPALILQHPKAPVMFEPPPFDPREQGIDPLARPAPLASVVQSIRAHNAERIEAGYPPDVDERLTPQQLAVLDAQDALERLAGTLGSYKRLATIVRNLAAIHGEAV